MRRRIQPLMGLQMHLEMDLDGHFENLKDFRAGVSEEELMRYFNSVRFSESKLVLIAQIIGWDAISYLAPLSEGFMSKYAEFLNWKLIQRYQEYSEDFRLSHNLLDKEELEGQFGCSGESTACNSLARQISESGAGIKLARDLPEANLVKMQERREQLRVKKGLATTEDVVRFVKMNKLTPEEWRAISEFQFLPQSFIAKHKHRLDWHIMDGYQDMSPKFKERHKNSIPQFVFVPKTQRDKEACIRKRSEKGREKWNDYFSQRLW